MNIGFIGLGKMGSRIARSLLRAGHSVRAFNRSRDKAEALEKDGAVIVASPAEAAEGAEAVWTMLSDDQAVSKVTFAKDGLAETLAPHAAHISSSTISISFTRQLAEQHEARGQKLISAPVFGRPDVAEAKKLLVAVAGDASLIDRYRPLFDAIGRRTFIVGRDPWRANAMKLGGNFMIASMLETFGEAFATLRKAEIDHHAFFEIMIELFGSPVYKNYGAAIANSHYEPAGFALKLGLKDIRQTLEMAHEFNAPMPFASILRDHYLSAMANGQEQMDWSSVAKVAARDAGLSEG